MAETPRNPNNINPLSPLGFKFSIKKVPTANYFWVACDVPSISVSPTKTGNPFTAIPRAGDHVQYSDMTATMNISEDFQSYLDIYNWVKGYAFPTTHREYAENVERLQGEAIYSDGVLIINTSHMNPSIEVVFHDMFPTGISNLRFDSRESDVVYLTADVTFSYRNFIIRPI